MFLWEHLQQTADPVLIYGTGNGAEKLFALCREYHVPVAGVFASDDHARSREFGGFPVLEYSQVQARYARAVVLLAFGAYQEEVLQRIEALAQRFEVLVPDLPLLGGAPLTPAYLTAHNAEITKARTLLADEKSRRVFDTMQQAKLTGALAAHYAEDTVRDADLSLLQLGQAEHYLDLGAYDGDTIDEFLRLTGGHYASITALEPDSHNLRKLSARTASLPRVTLHQAASWDCETTLTFSGKGGRNCSRKPDLPGRYPHLHPVPAMPVDRLHRDFTYVKMDVEGAEAETLRGMQATLNRCRPRLLISAYHKPDDFITLPLLLEQLCPGYRMYLRRNRCLPAWEIQLFALWPGKL